MPKFQIISPHDPAECLLALDEMLAHDPSFLEEMVVSCHFGPHTSYALIEASSEEEARSRLPEFLRKKAKIVQVGQVPPERVKSVHSEVV